MSKPHPVTRRPGSASKRKRVFLIVPYVAAYAEFEIAIRLTCELHHVQPVLARPFLTGHSQGVSIKKLIHSCGFAIADLSFPDRLNNVLELGVAWRDYSNPAFKILVVAPNQYELEAQLSDLKGACQVLGHNWEPTRLLGLVTEWLESDQRTRVKVDQTALREVYRHLTNDFRANYAYGDITRLFDDWRPGLKPRYEESCSHVHKVVDRRIAKLMRRRRKRR